jgi:hypothetical protein
MASLESAAVSFRTNDEDKDHDTNVTVEVRDRGGELAARISDTFGAFHDQTSNGPYELQVLNGTQKSELKNGTVLVRVDPKGDDTWRCNVEVDLHFDDNSTLTATADGLEYNEQTEQQQTFGIV